MSSPAGKHVGLKVGGLAAGTKLFLMSDNRTFLLGEHQAKILTWKVN